jgi:NADPH-dependent glutamate synthase beta subunit-like oxidoreductase
VSNLDKFKEMSKGLDLVQAIAEADRCLLCHDAPCSEGCPADTQPGEFIRKLRFKNVTGAIRTIKENNIMGGACGILCPTSRLCEDAFWWNIPGKEASKYLKNLNPDPKR